MSTFAFGMGKRRGGEKLGPKEALGSSVVVSSGGVVGSDGGIVRAALAAVSGRLGEIAVGMVEAFASEVPGYMGMRDPARVADVEETCRVHAGAVLAHLADGSTLGEEELRRLGEIGRRRFEEGISLPDLIHAYELGTRAILEAIDRELRRASRSPEHHVELLGPVAADVHELSTQLLAAVRRAYHEAERAVLMDERSFRRGIDDLLDAVEKKAENGEAAHPSPFSAIGLVPGEAHVTWVLEVAGADDDRARAAYLDRLADAAAVPLAAVGRRHCRSQRGQGVVGFVAFEGRGDSRTVAAAVEEALKKAPPPAPARALAGVGECEPDAEGIGESYGQARAALAFRRGKETLPSVLAYRDALPYLLLSKAPAIASAIVRRGVGLLALHDSTGDTNLVDALDAYLSCGENTGEAAKRLHIHRHTFVSRLRQIEQITGLSLRNREDVRLLDLGLMALRLLPARAAS